VKVRRFRHGATSISSDPLCSWPLRITRDECGECSDPDRWWETRRGVRTEIVELQKLLLDVVLHPMSFSAQCRDADSIVHRHEVGSPLPQGSSLLPELCCLGPDPIRPARRHIAISPHGGLYAMPSLCGSA
jgi:hypothetical protein